MSPAKRDSEALRAARERHQKQRAAERDAEKRVDAGLRDYVKATERVAAAEAAVEGKVAELENRKAELDRRITETREGLVSKTAGLRGQQAAAVLSIHEAGRTVEQIAELLDVPRKRTRALLNEARTTGGDTAGSGADAEAAAGDGGAPGLPGDGAGDGDPITAEFPTSLDTEEAPDQDADGTTLRAAAAGTGTPVAGTLGVTTDPHVDSASE
jgi:hypothetical protein